MYCAKCGQPIANRATICAHCGYQLVKSPENAEDKSSIAFAILGFFIPIVGLILFLVFHNEKPKTAKSAGKGALAGFITGFTISIILTVVFSFIGFNLMEQSLNLIPAYSGEALVSTESFSDEESWAKYVSVEIGELEITENEFFIETSLDVTVTNLYEQKSSFYITLEAVDEQGCSLGTDMITVDILNSNQSRVVEAFEYIDAETVEEYENATFKVLEISKTTVY